MKTHFIGLNAKSRNTVWGSVFHHPRLRNFIDQTGNQLLEKSLKKDVAWAVTQSVSHLDTEVQVGSWTNFNKATEEHVFEKSILEYLPTIAQPPE